MSLFELCFEWWVDGFTRIYELFLVMISLLITERLVLLSVIEWFEDLFDFEDFTHMFNFGLFLSNGDFIVERKQMMPDV